MPGLFALMIFRASTVFCWSAGVLYGVLALQFAGLARDAGERQLGALPGVVVVDLGDRAAGAVHELLLDRAEMHALLLQRVAAGEVELEREDADEACGHFHTSGARRAPDTAR